MPLIYSPQYTPVIQMIIKNYTHWQSEKSLSCGIRVGYSVVSLSMNLLFGTGVAHVLFCCNVFADRLWYVFAKKRAVTSWVCHSPFMPDIGDCFSPSPSFFLYSMGEREESNIRMLRQGENLCYCSNLYHTSMSCSCCLKNYNRWPGGYRIACEAWDRMSLLPRAAC